MRAPRFMLLAAVALTALAGCGHWPPARGGGAAEFAGPAPALGPGADATARHLGCSLSAFDMLRAAAAARGRSAGRVALLADQAARAKREFFGLTEADAEASLAALDADMRRLRQDIPAAPEARCTA